MAITYNNLYLDLRQRFRAAGDIDPSRAARELIWLGTDAEELCRRIREKGGERK